MLERATSAQGGEGAAAPSRWRAAQAHPTRSPCEVGKSAAFGKDPQGVCRIGPDHRPAGASVSSLMGAVRTNASYTGAHPRDCATRSSWLEGMVRRGSCAACGHRAGVSGFWCWGR